MSFNHLTAVCFKLYATVSTLFEEGVVACLKPSSGLSSHMAASPGHSLPTLVTASSQRKCGFFRRIFRVSYVDRVTNQEVLERLGIERQLLQIIDRRHLRFLGHIIRKEALEELSLSGKINGKRARGRQRKHFFKKAFSDPWVC